MSTPMAENAFSLRRLRALCRKESYQILRDPSSFLIAFVIPLMLLLIFGYGINLDSSKLRIGILMEQQSSQTNHLVSAFSGSPYISPIISTQRTELLQMLQTGQIRGLIVIPIDFDKNLLRPTSTAPIQVITDGSEPNIAVFVQGYAQGVWQTWLTQQAQDQGADSTALIDIDLRYWFNPAAISRNFIIPGAISIIMTVIGAILTSLVIAREWERGTMEALLSTQITRTELLLSKLLPYYLLAMVAQLLCFVVAVFVMQVPFRGSVLLLFILSSLFLASTLGMGLLISTLTRDQFNAAMVALNVAFLPAVMLSGFLFEIDSMPAIIRLITHLIPARYFVSTLHTLFLAGNIPLIITTNLLFLIASAILFIGLTALKTKRRLD
ncbi:ABC transporter permease [Serratia proteamaculans]